MANPKDWFQPYSHIRGFNYTPSTAFNDVAFWRDYDAALIERELSYAERLGLNSARIFLSYIVFEHDGEKFLDRVRHFLRRAHTHGISVMPVVWDSCFDETRPIYETQKNYWVPNPGVERLGESFWEDGEHYCRALVDALQDEPGLLIWDVMNEPRMTSWLNGPDGDSRTQVVWRFVKHFCQTLKQLDPHHPITVGVHIADDIMEIGEYVDMISCHDYLPTRAQISTHLQKVRNLCEKYQKPGLISEIGCLARSNPYDVAIETCQIFGTGWYLWELMIGSSMWRDIHGVVYPDGTVRDPAIVAAIRGFYRKRTGEIIQPNINKEGQVTTTCQLAQAWLADDMGDYHVGLQILERLANQLEVGELVPMRDLPSARIFMLGDDTPSNRITLRELLTHWSTLLSNEIG